MRRRRIIPARASRCDLVLAGIEIRPPFLKPAKMDANGLLVPDTTKTDVVFNLPKVKLRVSQGSDTAAVLDVSLTSLGVAGLDDPGDLSAAELITMEPAYAFIGDGRVVGFAFRAAFLDLADGYTPPEVLDQFGFDESWTGLYLPEIRVFFAPNGAEDFAVNVGVENLLIGLGDSSGITGDFDVAVINQGSGDLALGARFFDTQGRAIGIRKLNDTTAEALVPATSRMVVDVTGGRAPYTVNANFDGSDHAGVLHTITATATPKTVAISASDTSSPVKNQNLTINVRLREVQAVEPPPGAAPDQAATLQTTGITLDGQPQTAPPLRLVSDSGNAIVVGIDGMAPNPATQWQVDGSPAGTAATVTADLAGGQTRTVRATVPGQTVTEIDGYFRFDHPPVADVVAFSINPLNTSADQATDPSASAPWKPPARQFLPTWRNVLSRITSKTITIEGRASFEGDDEKAKYNYLLSQRRAQGLNALIENDPTLAGFTVNFQPPDIAATAQPPTGWTNTWKGHGAPREQWWKAEIRDFSVTLPGPVIDGQAQRPASPVPPPPVPVPRDVPPDNPAPPPWFRQARLKVRIVQDQFVAVELSGQVDFQTALEDNIDTSGGVTIPNVQGMGNNPADGITDFLFLYQTDPASQTDAVKLYIGADPNDRDGLVKTGQLPGQALEPPNTGRNILGMTTVFTPLLAEIAPANPADGGIAPIVLSAAVIALPVALAEIKVDGENLLNVERVVLFGGEANFRRVGDRWETTVLFDVETAISVKIKLGGFLLLEIPRDTPLAVRYKAIGLKFGYPPGSDGGLGIAAGLRPVEGLYHRRFRAGADQAAEPAGADIAGAGRADRADQPAEFRDRPRLCHRPWRGYGRARPRAPAAGPAGAAGAHRLCRRTEGAGRAGRPRLHGDEQFRRRDGDQGRHRRVADPDQAAGRGADRGGADPAGAGRARDRGGDRAGGRVAGSDPAGAVGLRHLRLPRPLRDALQPRRERHHLADAGADLAEGPGAGRSDQPAAWKPEIGRWAFGVGITLGTMGSPIIFNVKGMFLLELPGPRILLMVKANLLAVLPELKDKNAEGTFLCVIDLDFGRGMLTIGLSIDFSIKPIVEIKIPIEAFFNLKKGSDWHVYLGTFPGTDTEGRPMPGPIRIKILEVFDGAGYTMVSGHGIPSYQPTWTDLPALPAVQGVALAAGLEVSIVWGNTSINLYLRVTAGFNAVLGFEPFYVGGLLYLRGELKLFIISLSASAGLSVQIGEKKTLVGGVEVKTQISRIDGEVCGELDLFFFTLKGCVDFHLGEEQKILPPAPRLVTAASLVGRSPALAMGTGTDRKIDAKIGDAVSSVSQPASNLMPVVPIDSIPVLVMAATPRDDTLKIFGEDVEGSSGAPSDGYVKRGDFSYRYDLKEVRLETADGSPAVTAGDTPSGWWS